MRLEIFSTAAQQILAHARRARPHEACGLLLGRAGRIEAVVETANVAARPEAAFEIEPELLLRCHRDARAGGRAVLGWYHSHPSGLAEPSAIDAERAVEDGKLWLIVADDGLRAFRTVSGGPVGGRFEEVTLTGVPSYPAGCSYPRQG